MSPARAAPASGTKADGTSDAFSTQLRETVANFAQKEIAPIAAEVDKKNAFPNDMWTKFGEMGLLGVTVGENDGGLGKGCVPQNGSRQRVQASANMAFPPLVGIWIT